MSEAEFLFPERGRTPAPGGRRARQPAGRVRSLVWPREHGAWGILLAPLLTGAWIGLPGGSGVAALGLFVAAAVALFCLRTPVEIWLEISPLRAQTDRERRAVIQAIFFYSFVAAGALAVLLWSARLYGLLLLGAVVGVLFLVQALLRKLGRETRMVSQWIGSLGLTSTAAGAYYAVSGQLDARALMLWAANWLFAANQIHFVQLRIGAARAATRGEKLARGWGFLAGEAATAALLLLAWVLGHLPGLALLAFGAVLARGAAWFLERPAPLAIRRLGFTELAHNLVFAALLILGFHYRPWG